MGIKILFAINPGKSLASAGVLPKSLLNCHVMSKVSDLGYNPSTTLYDVLFANDEAKGYSWPDPIGAGFGNTEAEGDKRKVVGSDDKVFDGYLATFNQGLGTYMQSFVQSLMSYINSYQALEGILTSMFQGLIAEQTKEFALVAGGYNQQFITLMSEHIRGSLNLSQLYAQGYQMHLEKLKHRH